MENLDKYQNPLINRYASKQMAYIFSDQNKFTLWRKLWIALAESQKELGLNITDEQIYEMKKYVDQLNLDVAAAREKEVRHDVMAHVYAFGQQAKSAMPIIHLGATSCFVTDNADILMYRDALNLILDKLVAVMGKLKNFSLKYKALPTLGFTHFQPAQLTTVGKRAALWLQDLYIDYENLKFVLDSIRLRGVKGTTGTQASFMNLFGGDEQKVKQLEKLVAKKMGIEKCFSVTGQTYPRKFDYLITSCLSMIAQSAYKFAEDIRLLQHLKEIEEPFEKNQIGSSAMAYKRNPMRCERICSLARYVISIPVNQAMTSATQWFERTLDDSANRRITIPQAFLAVDSILNLYLNVSENLVVNENMIAARINTELPFMLTENIIMECVKAGGNRQELHEQIRQHSMEAAKNVKQGKENDLIDRIRSDEMFKAIWDKLANLTEPSLYTGRAENQVVEFISNDIDSILERHKFTYEVHSEIKV